MLISLLQGAAAFILSLTQARGDAIPDFSHVGYRHSDSGIPTYPVVKTLKAPADSIDALPMIQEAIDSFSGAEPGMILLEAGTYYCSAPVHLNKSNLVLSGEGEKTRIVATYRTSDDMVIIGTGKGRKLKTKQTAAVTEDYVPVGRMYAEVDHPEYFSPGDHIVIYRPGTAEWIHDIRMDSIADNYDKPVKQWAPEDYNLQWEREVTGVQGSRVYFDNPVVMALDRKYGGGSLILCATERIQESGIENLCLDTVFDPAPKDKNGNCIDENHARRAVRFASAENCWARKVVTHHFAQASICFFKRTRLCTAVDCESLEPVSKITGGRRYAFYFCGGECCLFLRCHCDSDRHQFVSSGRTCGPNAVVDCWSTNPISNIGPHNNWGTGILYDRLRAEGGQLTVQDRNSWGGGHGWSGANMVFWNCETSWIVCQSPWASAQNWAVGCYGEFMKVSRPDGPWEKGVWENSNAWRITGPQRPRGVIVSHGTHVDPPSLYWWQLEQRRQSALDKMKN